MNKNRGLSSVRIIKTIQFCVHERRSLEDTVCNATGSTGVREACKEIGFIQRIRAQSCLKIDKLVTYVITGYFPVE